AIVIGLLHVLQRRAIRAYLPVPQPGWMARCHPPRGVGLGTGGTHQVASLADSAFSTLAATRQRAKGISRGAISRAWHTASTSPPCAEAGGAITSSRASWSGFHIPL